ncbi:MAG: acetyl-coenzyme A synthetase N-terminal domain-containing protein, partial [Halobacteria archaeon]|nr:acetyl-coenzyme A synthetase N-terminal domain-containing protein [Halobacteria archaeon]
MSEESETELEARLPEQESFEPPEEFVEQANVTDGSVHERFDENWPDCWEEAADLVDWYEGYDEVLDDSDAPFYEWFVGGELNACHNCVDRHLDERGDATAVEWIGEHGDTRSYTYQELYDEVNELASALRELGVGEGDVVTMYMPMVPELPVALATRMESASSEYLVTCDGYYRRGEALKHKEKADEGLSEVDHGVEDVVVVDRLRDDYNHSLGENEHDYGALLNDHRGETVEPVERDAEDMLF